ncbi:MAG: DUF4105 domain-containing protein [Pseudomonadota bacterium]|mgnify:CR=1 FL=1
MKRLGILLLLVSSVTSVQARRPPDPAVAPTISLLTFAPGEVYWQRFGHNALLVREPSGPATVYNYGMFDFQQKNFFINFARGKMLYRLDTDSLWRTLAIYQRENRWVVEQRLNLLPTQARELAEFLAWNALPENADYRYDYFADNCSTRVRDAIDRVLGGDLRRQLEARTTTVSYRYESVRMMSPIPALALGIDLVDGPATEAPLNVWQQSFLPEALMQALRSVQTLAPDGSRRPLVYVELPLQSGSGPEAPAQPLSFVWMLLGAGIASAVLLLWLNHLRDHKPARIAFSALSFVLVLVSGLGGLILLAIWTLTEHWAWHANHNLLLLNPLSLLLLPACIKTVRKIPGINRRSVYMAMGIALGALIVALLPGQSQSAWVALLLPMHLSLSYALFRATRI